VIEDQLVAKLFLARAFSLIPFYRHFYHHDLLIRSLVSFAEIIPQSVCTRHGLYIGAKMVGFVRVLLWTLVRPFVLNVCRMSSNVEVQGIIAWPIAKILELTLGSHHGIIYRRAGTMFRYLSLLCCNNGSVELKELIALHSSVGEYGGDLRSDTVTIIGATLDLQEKNTSHVRLCCSLINWEF